MKTLTKRFEPTGAVLDDEENAPYYGQACEIVEENPEGWEGPKVRFSDGKELLVQSDELVEV